MILNGINKAHFRLPALLTSVFLLFLLLSCSDSATDPPPPQPPMTLDIFPTNGIYEVNTGFNFYISGSLVDQHGNRLSGRRVYFSVDPPDMGTITPYAMLDPQQENGFQTQVVYNCPVDTTVQITGQVREDNTVLAQDMMSVWVRPPQNQ